MEQVRLMNRIDTKYVTNRSQLGILLPLLTNDYRIQEISGRRQALYHTLYLDTSGLEMFVVHHNGHNRREKIRIREYTDSKSAFLEIKIKNNKGRTNKTRMPLPSYEKYHNREATAFLNLNAQFPCEELAPHIETIYDRITLVNYWMTERLTIDTNLRFRNQRTGRCYDLPGLVIIELKRDVSAVSCARSLMQYLSIQPMGISKYCLGSVLTNPDIKYNRFKPKLIRINKVIKN